jgi:hypothetical protein
VRRTSYCFRAFKNVIRRADNAIVLSGSAGDVTAVKLKVEVWLKKLERRDVSDIKDEPG